MLGTSLGNYRVVERLGEGGMGVVYVGRHEALGRRVVVKVLRREMSGKSDMLQRFFNEAQAATAIKHPGIAQVFDVGTTPDGQAYFVMELLEGETLSARLQQRRLEPEACCRIGRQIANVLQAAHAAGITHRDLKPDNLFLVPDAEVLGGERVKVLDFGIAKLTGEAHVSVRTRTGLVMGTPSYMSPEQCRGIRNADARSDIYALGCILFKMACGRAPFLGVGLGDIVGGHLHQPPPNPQDHAPGLPAGLAALITQMLAKQPDARPQTMIAVSQAFDEILSTLSGSPARAATGPPAPSPRSMPGLPPVTSPAGPPTPLPRPRSAPPARAASALPVRPRPPLEELETTPTTPLEDLETTTATPLGDHDTTQLSPPLSPPPPTPMLAPSSSTLDELATAPVPRLPSVPLARAPAPFPMLRLSPLSTTISGAAGISYTHPRPGRRWLPFVLGGLVIVGALIAIAIVLATEGSDPDSPRRVSYSDDLAASPVPSEIATAAVEDAPTTPMLAPLADAAAEPDLLVTADDLEARCRGLQAARKWSELERCAGELKPLEPARAAELETRAVEEARSAPRIAAAEAALRAGNLKRARSELDQVWPESVDHPELERKYELAETQAIARLAAELAQVKDSGCEAYNLLLAKARGSRPARVVTEAARRTRCTLAPRCDADALARKGQAQYSASQFAASLVSFEAAYACNPGPARALKAFLIACNLRDVAKSRLYWKRLSLALRTQALGICVRNGITEPTLNAP